MASTQTKPLTIKDLIQVFDVTPMTLLHWRAPAESARKTALPFTRHGRAVTFNAAKVKAWANKNGVPMKVDPLAIADGAEHRSKPGPKASPKKPDAAKKASRKPTTTDKRRAAYVRAGARKKATAEA